VGVASFRRTYVITLRWQLVMRFRFLAPDSSLPSFVFFVGANLHGDAKAPLEKRAKMGQDDSHTHTHSHSQSESESGPIQPAITLPLGESEDQKKGEEKHNPYSERKPPIHAVSAFQAHSQDSKSRREFNHSFIHVDCHLFPDIFSPALQKF